jgi:hypothetical protein
MPDMTEEEYDALDELWTKTTPKVGPNGTGFISRREARLMGMDALSINGNASPPPCNPTRS